MRNLKAVHALAACSTLTALGGCVGGSQLAPAPPLQAGSASASSQRPPFQDERLSGFRATLGGAVRGHGAAGPDFMDRRAVGKPLVFISYGGAIDIYLQGGKNKLVGQITGPIGDDLATDTAGDLYSANESFSSNTVTVYAPPYTEGPKLTLTGRVSYPLAVSRQGTVAVLGCTNPSGSQCTGGFLFYAAGSTTPCATVVVDFSAFPNGIFGAAFDHNGNLYFDGTGSGTDAPLAVGKIAGGCKAKNAETLTTTNAVVYAGDIKVNKTGRIAILAAIGTSPYQVVIYTYDPPKHGSLGSPVSSTPLPETIDNASGTFAFQASGRRLWSGYYGVGSSYISGAYEFAYPAGGAPEKTIVGGLDLETLGVAVTPTLIP